MDEHLDYYHRTQAIIGQAISEFHQIKSDKSRQWELLFSPIPIVFIGLIAAVSGIEETVVIPAKIIGQGIKKFIR